MITDSILKQCVLFKEIDDEGIKYIKEKFISNIKKYTKDQVIALEGETCKALGIVLDGNIEIQKTYSTGKIVTLTKLEPGAIFGEALMFSHNKQYPANIISLKKSKILFINEKDIVNISKTNINFLLNLTKLLSGKLLLLSDKIQYLSYGTIRQKICHFLLDEYKRRGNLEIKINTTKQSIAENMGVQRPSLSRELINMREEGFIQFNRTTIKILDLTKIENELL